MRIYVTINISRASELTLPIGLTCLFILVHWAKRCTKTQYDLSQRIAGHSLLPLVTWHKHSYGRIEQLNNILPLFYNIRKSAIKVCSIVANIIDQRKYGNITMRLRPKYLLQRCMCQIPVSLNLAIQYPKLRSFQLSIGWNWCSKFSSNTNMES